MRMQYNTNMTIDAITSAHNSTFGLGFCLAFPVLLFLADGEANGDIENGKIENENAITS